MGSVETVAVLFTDLVGSTELASRVGPERADELRVEHFGLLREAITAADGREVKNLGDGLMVVFPSAAAAIDCAVSMQQRIDVRNRRSDDHFGIRVGIAMGDASRNDGDYFGPPVVEAARLCATAAGGQVLLTEVTRVMVGRRGGHGFSPVGALDLKGLPEAVVACELVWEPLPAARIALPKVLQDRPETRDVGHEAVRRRLSEQWELAGSGKRRTVLLAGKPGIGKTRMATQLALAAHGAGACVLYGHCDEELRAPYQPWREALGDYVERAPAEVLADVGATRAGELSLLVPDLELRLPNIREPRSGDAETERYLLFEAVAGLLEHASRADPLIVILDDLQWADEPSLLLLRYVISSSAERRLMIIGTLCDSDEPADRPLVGVLADLVRLQGVERVDLEGPDQKEVGWPVRVAADQTLDRDGAALPGAGGREGDGDPFFVAPDGPPSFVAEPLGEPGRAVRGHVSSGRFVGREDELAALDGESGVVVIAGDAGVGKSRLVAELERRARAEGKLVLIGECLELTDGELPYAPIVAALRPLLRRGGALDGVSVAERGELARLWPELGPADHAPGKDGEGSSQARVFALLLELLMRLGSEQPVLFVVEDLHWADRSTRDFLAFLVRAARGGRLSLVVTLRAEEVPRAHPLRPFIAELTRVRGVRRLELVPFTLEELALQVEGILGERPSPDLVQRLFERGEGNAFYTEELLAAGDGAELPASLRDVLLVRIERLSEPARRLLGAAAVAGRAVDERLLAAVGEVPGAVFALALREVLAEQVLLPRGNGGSYAFRHALVREAVYRDLLASERAKLHAALARTLVRRPELAATGIGVSGELAHHWYAAGKLVPAFEASVQAGADAERAFASTETQRHCERALLLWDRVPDAARVAGLDRPALLARAAGAAVHADHPGRAAELALRAVAELDPAHDSVRLARMYMLVGRGRWLSADHLGALAAYREAVRLVPPDPPSPERAFVLAGEAQALMLSGSSTEARARCDEALAIARAVGDRLVQAHVHNTLSGLGWLAGDPVEHAASARTIAFELGAVEEIGRSYANGSEGLDYGGRTEEAIALAEEGIAAAPHWGLHDFVVYLTSSIAGWQVRLGRFEEAERLCADAAPRGHTAAAPRHQTAGLLAVAHGEFDAAEVELERAEELSRGIGGPEWWPATQAAIGMLRLRQGRLDDAAGVIRQALDAVEDPQYAPWLPDFADVYPTAARIEADRAAQARAAGLSAAEVQDAAADAVTRLDTMLAQIPEDRQPPRPLACRSLAAAEVTRARGQSDPTTWRRAADEFRALSEPYTVAYGQFRQAGALLAAARRDAGAGHDAAACRDAVGHAATGAARPLREAHAITVRLGERPLRAEIEALAQRSGVPLA